MAEPPFSPNFKTDPYWWDAAPPPEPAAAALPARTDVAIVGAGYTGLSAALTLARAGRTLAVLEADRPGAGASTRNAGNVSRTLKTGFRALAAAHGPERAAAYYRESARAIAYVRRLIEREQIACEFRSSGRYYAAHSPRAYEALAGGIEELRRRCGYEADMVPRAEQGCEIGSEHYYGGQRVHGPAILHASLYFRGLYDRALAAGAQVHGHTRVTGIARDGRDFIVETPRGRLAAGEVIVATNAHTGADNPVFRYLRRGVVPIRSYIIATEPVAPERLARILPGNRPVIDTRKVLFHIQPSPDGRRLIFGGHAGRNYGDLRTLVRRIHRHFARLFPDFDGVRVSHASEGYFGFSFDSLPHIGRRDGVHYATAFCGTGLPMGTWLGHKLALRILEAPDATTAFDDRPFPRPPLYTGRPWFLPAVVRYYHLRDSLPF